MAILVNELMTTHPECLSPDVSLQEAATHMLEKDYGFLPLCENDRLVGCITDRDMAIRAIAKGKDPNQTKVREIMTEKVLYCYADETIENAGKSMEKQQIRRLIVLNNDKEKRFVGVISLGDICQSHQQQLSGEILEFVSRKAA